MRDHFLPPFTQGPIQPLKFQSRRSLGVGSRSLADRVGILASILCAIHCAATPFILLAAPAFGGIWSHPASHWGTAILVVPLASLSMVQGYRKHHRKWILACGSSGIGSVKICL